MITDVAFQASEADTLIHPRTLTLTLAAPMVAIVIYAGTIALTTKPAAPRPAEATAPPPTPAWITEAERAPEPSGVDGWPIWQRADAARVDWWHDDHDPLYDGADFQGAPPSTSDREKLIGYLSANEAALSLYLDGAAADYVRLPPPDPDGQRASWAFLSDLRDLAVIKARLALLDGRADEAATLLIANHRAGGLLARSGDGLLTALSGVAMQDVYGGSMIHVAHNERTTADTIERMLAAIDRNSVRTAEPLNAKLFAHMRHETVVMLDGAQQVVDRFDKRVEELRDELGDAGEFVVGITEGIFGPYRRMYEIEHTLRHEHGVDIRLADRNATVARFDAAVETILAMLDEPGRVWTKRLQETIIEPSEIDADNVDDALDRYDRLTADDRRLSVAEAGMMTVLLHNAAGRHTLHTEVQAFESLINDVLDHATTHRADTIRLAVRLHELRFGERPESLAALVQRSLLDAVPLDPYDHKPMRYDPVRGRVWSVGPDGEDDGGEPGSRVDEDGDMVWPIGPGWRL